MENRSVGLGHLPVMPAVESVGKLPGREHPREGTSLCACEGTDRRALLHVRSGKGGWGWGCSDGCSVLRGRKAGIHREGMSQAPQQQGVRGSGVRVWSRILGRVRAQKLLEKAD